MMKTALAQKPVIILTILNLLDLVLTLIGIMNGYINEGNPVMRYFLNTGVGNLISIKVALSILAFFIIGYGYCKYPWVRYAVYFPLVVYLYVMTLHISWIYLLFAGKIS